MVTESTCADLNPGADQLQYTAAHKGLRKLNKRFNFRNFSNFNTKWTVTFHTNTVIGPVAPRYHPTVPLQMEMSAKKRAYANVLISLRVKS